MQNEILSYTREKNIVLPPGAPALFLEYHQLLQAENQKVNLTRITQLREVIIKHFIDSLEILALYPDLSEQMPRLLDMGSGAGFPGIPLAIACPGVYLTLFESSGKKARFLQEVTGKLGLKQASALPGREEEKGRDPLYREKYHLVTSRAVARLNILLELCLPFVVPGGIFAAYKGPDAAAEVQAAKNALSELQAEPERI